MLSDVFSIAVWWFMLFAIGIAVFPLTLRIFGNFVDRGYAFSKVIGLVLLSYTLFVAAHLKLLAITTPAIVAILVLILFLSLAVKKWRPGEKQRLPWKLILVEEAMFFLAILFWSFIRGFAPEIHGLEKFMDFGFVNSILAGKTLPPLDMWLTKAPDYPNYLINYYYFGHFVTALLTRLSGLNSVITYNLMIATLFAFTFALSFSLGLNLFYLFLSHGKEPGTHIKLSKPIIVGTIAAFLVALGGNLHTIYLYTTGYPNDNPLPFWQIMSGYNPAAYWYPNATRFIPYTIHEFPIYSFVVSDLHGHVLDIPFVLTTLALLLHLISKKRHPKETQISKLNPSADGQNHSLKAKSFQVLRFSFELLTLNFELLLLGLLLAVMYMTNAWDGLIYMILAGLVILYLSYRGTGESSKQDDRLGTIKIFNMQIHIASLSALSKTAVQGFIIILAFIVFSLPFSIHFKPFVSGFGVVCPPEQLAGKSIGPFIFEAGDKCARSPLWMLAILWGFFVYNAVGFIYFIVLPKLKGGFRQLQQTDVFVVLMIFVSTLLLLFPEFFYAKDIYPLHYRANTMFKLGYEAFMMMQIAGGYIFFRILLSPFTTAEKITRFRFALSSLPRLSWMLGFAILFYFVAIYPNFAIASYYGNLKFYKGLDGLSWLAQQYPEDYKAILWLRTQVSKCHSPLRSVQSSIFHLPFDSAQDRPSSAPCDPQPVILEAVGESYTDFARVSANTGLPTIVGWPVHEWLWRGSYDEPSKRIPLVERLYTSTSQDEVGGLLQRYQVSYVFVGTEERQKYQGLTEEVFKQLGEVVFESGDTRIYKIH